MMLPIQGSPNMSGLKREIIGTSTGAFPPEENVQSSHVERGDTLVVHETPNDLELITQMEVAEKVMKEDLEVLRRLAE